MPSNGRKITGQERPKRDSNASESMYSGSNRQDDLLQMVTRPTLH